MALTAQLFRADDERTADRLPVNLDGTLRQPDDQRPVDVVIDDLSATGFRMTCGERLPVNAVITVGIAGLGRHTARIVRAIDGQYGCRFLTPVDIAEPITVQPQTIVAGAFGGPGTSWTADQDTPPLDAFEQRLRRVRGPIIVTGLIVPWLVIGAIATALL
jgi:hypothetical protein